MAWTERYVRGDAAGGGDGTTDANSGGTGSWTLDEAITNAAAGQRINVKNVGTYSYAAIKTFANAGSATTPIWWRGFNSTIGDLDSVTVSTNFPSLATTGTGNYFTISGASQWFSCMKFTSAVTTASRGTLYVTGAACRFWNIRSEGTAADVDSTGLTGSGTCDGLVLFNCYFKATSSAPCISIGSSANNSILGCWMEAGLNGITSSSGGSIVGCVFNNQTGDGINLSSANQMIIYSNSIYSAGSDGIELTTSVSGNVLIANNVIVDSAGYAINNSASTNAYAALFGNSYYNNASGNLNNVYESHDIGSVSESATPFANAGSGDFRLVGGSLARATGVPVVMLDSGIINYQDMGALQRLESGSLVPRRGGLNLAL